MYDDVCILHVWHLFPTQTFPISAGRGITGSRAPAAEAVPELQPTNLHQTLPPCLYPTQRSTASPSHFHTTPPPQTPAPQQLMPALPGRCGTWSPGGKNSPNEYPDVNQCTNWCFSPTSLVGSLPFAQLINIQDWSDLVLQFVDGERLVSKNTVSTVWGPTLPQR